MKLKINNSNLVIIFLAAAVIFLLPNFALASVTDGEIDAADKYAWGENLGWLNFGAANGNVRVTDAGLTGYAWSANHGWINLAPTDGGVMNDGAGDLSGHAWGENLGWLDFSGVAINSAGEFSGQAVVENDNSRVSFSGANFKLKTDWRPRLVRPACDNSADDDGDGRADYPADPGCSGLTDENEVDQGAVIIPPAPSQPVAPPQTSTPEINPPAEEVKPDLKPDAEEPKAEQEPAEIKIPTTKPSAQTGQQSSAVISASPLEQVFGKLKRIFGPILEKLAGLKPITSPEIPLENLVPREAPLALRGQWQIMPAEPAEKFVLAPLPAEILKLAKKFPSLNKIFEQINISKITDISRLKSAVLTLPGLTESATLAKAGMAIGQNMAPVGLIGLPAAEIKAGRSAWLEGLPLASLSAEIKNNLPSEIVFAKAGGELVDYNIDLIINEEGRSQQKITVLANQTLELVVKPDGQVNGVKGYLIFKSAASAARARSFDLVKILATPACAAADGAAGWFFVGKLQDFLSSLIFAEPSLAVKQAVPVTVEEKLVLSEFNYADADGDGLWTAEIKTPAAEGQYEVITVLNYKDPELGDRAIKLTTVIDPEGYIYEQYGDKEIRVPGAVVSLYWLNPESKKYQVWPSEEYNQDNPQITDVSGKYSFLVPPGSYHLKIEAPGYLLYEGKPFLVKAGGGVHVNVELKIKYGWLKAFDWKTILLILVAVFLVYNFYKDKRRKSIN